MAFHNAREEHFFSVSACNLHSAKKKNTQEEAERIYIPEVDFRGFCGFCEIRQLLLFFSVLLPGGHDSIPKGHHCPRILREPFWFAVVFLLMTPFGGMKNEE
jgi:hypothetical protein